MKISNMSEADKIYKKYHRKYPYVGFGEFFSEYRSRENYESWGAEIDNDPWPIWFKNRNKQEKEWIDYLDSY